MKLESLPRGPRLDRPAEEAGPGLGGAFRDYGGDRGARLYPEELSLACVGELQKRCSCCERMALVADCPRWANFDPLESDHREEIHGCVQDALESARASAARATHTVGVETSDTFWAMSWGAQSCSAIIHLTCRQLNRKGGSMHFACRRLARIRSVQD